MSDINLGILTLLLKSNGSSMMLKLLRMISSRSHSKKRTTPIALTFLMSNLPLLVKSRLSLKTKMEKTPKLELLRFNFRQRLMRLENGRLDLEMRPRSLLKQRLSPLLRVLGTGFLHLQLKKAVKLKLRKLTLLIRLSPDFLLMLKKMDLKQPTLLQLKMPLWRMPVCLNCLVLTELAIWRNRDPWLSSLRSLHSPSLWQTSPPLSALQ
jgi:hypothetical protein